MTKELTLKKLNQGCGFTIMPLSAKDTVIEFSDFADDEGGFITPNTLNDARRNYKETLILSDHFLFGYSLEYSQQEEFKTAMANAGYNDFLGDAHVDDVDFNTLGVNDYVILGIIGCQEVLKQINN